MSWNEDWIKADRPPASAHTRKYGFWPQGKGRLALVYFVTITLGDYLALTFFGNRPLIILGLPLLIWITVVFALLTIGGILVFTSYPDRSDQQPH